MYTSYELEASNGSLEGFTLPTFHRLRFRRLFPQPVIIRLTRYSGHKKKALKISSALEGAAVQEGLSPKLNQSLKPLPVLQFLKTLPTPKYNYNAI